MGRRPEDFLDPAAPEPPDGSTVSDPGAANEPQPTSPEAPTGPTVEEAVVRVDLSDSDAKKMLEELVDGGIVSWTQVAQKVLQSLQPPQTSTHVPQLPGIRERYEKNTRWPAARPWMYAQYRPCPTCGGVMSLSHDHVLEKDLLGDKADIIENLRFLCYRCNQSRHWEHGGKLELGTAAAAIYLLFKHKPKTIEELDKRGREIGMTQAILRFEETWALALYLQSQGKYELDQVHAEIPADDLKRYQAYFKDTNAYFEALATELRTKYADRVARREHLQVLMSSKQARKRVLAATALGIIEKPRMRTILTKTELAAADRKAVLTAEGSLQPSEVRAIGGSPKPKIALYHLLKPEEREELLTAIESKLTELKTKHGIPV